MTIFIHNKEMPDERAKEFTNPGDQQIVRAWCQSDIDHEFRSEESFKKALRRNRKTLESPRTIEFFTSGNYLFSTKAKYRKETLYFKDQKTGETGRLRRQHETGPLAKIDKKGKMHRFVSKERFKFLQQWHVEHPCQLPRFCSYEKREKAGKHHIDFAFCCESGEVSRWHGSEGTVKTNTQYLDRRLASALKNILEIR